MQSDISLITKIDCAVNHEVLFYATSFILSCYNTVHECAHGNISTGVYASKLVDRVDATLTGLQDELDFLFTSNV